MAFIGDERIVHILADDRFALGIHFIFGIFGAEGAENGHVAEVIEMMIDRRNAQRAHGSDEQRTMEGAEFGNETGQQAEIIQRFEQPDGKLQKQAGNGIDDLGQIVKAAIQRGIFDLLDFGVQLFIDLLRVSQGVSSTLITVSGDWAVISFFTVRLTSINSSRA